MRRLAPLLLLVLAACGADETGEGGSCAAALVYEDAYYQGVANVDDLPAAGAPVSGVKQPGCIDTDTREVAARRLRGIPAAVAMYADHDARTVYVNTGYFTELPDHPLHRQFHGTRDRPGRQVRGESCLIDGRVFATFFSLEVRAGDRRVNVVVDAHTTISGFDRAGLPYLEEGDAVRIHGRACHDGDPPVVLARRIEPG